MSWIITLIIVGIIIFLLLIMGLMRAGSASDEASRHNIEKLTRKEDDNGVI